MFEDKSKSWWVQKQWRKRGENLWKRYKRVWQPGIEWECNKKKLRWSSDCWGSRERNVFYLYLFDWIAGPLPPLNQCGRRLQGTVLGQLQPRPPQLVGESELPSASQPDENWWEPSGTLSIIQGKNRYGINEVIQQAHSLTQREIRR